MRLKRTDEFRQDAVRIALTSGLTRKQVADDLGIGMSTLNKMDLPRFCAVAWTHFKLLFFRKPEGFSILTQNVFCVDYKTRLCIGR